MNYDPEIREALRKGGFADVLPQIQRKPLTYPTRRPLSSWVTPPSAAAPATSGWFGGWWGGGERSSSAQPAPSQPQPRRGRGLLSTMVTGLGAAAAIGAAAYAAGPVAQATGLVNPGLGQTAHSVMAESAYNTVWNAGLSLAGIPEHISSTTCTLPGTSTQRIGQEIYKDFDRNERPGHSLSEQSPEYESTLDVRNIPEVRQRMYEAGILYPRKERDEFKPERDENNVVVRMPRDPFVVRGRRITTVDDAIALIAEKYTVEDQEKAVRFFGLPVNYHYSDSGKVPIKRLKGKVGLDTLLDILDRWPFKAVKLLNGGYTVDSDGRYVPCADIDPYHYGRDPRWQTAVKQRLLKVGKEHPRTGVSTRSPQPDRVAEIAYRFRSDRELAKIVDFYGLGRGAPVADLQLKPRSELLNALRQLDARDLDDIVVDWPYKAPWFGSPDNKTPRPPVEWPVKGMKSPPPPEWAAQDILKVAHVYEKDE